jgi:hypothetical protein
LYFYALISLSSLLVGVASRSSSSSSLFLSLVLCVCLRGLCARSFSSFSSLFFFFYNANIMSAARPIDSRRLHVLRS